MVNSLKKVFFLIFLYRLTYEILLIRKLLGHKEIVFQRVSEQKLMET